MNLRFRTLLKRAPLVIVIAALICSMLNIGCKGKSPKDVNIRLKWLHQAQFAGFYFAKESGGYSQRGLNVNLLPGGIDYPAIQLVASGSDQFGVTGADSLFGFEPGLIWMFATMRYFLLARFTNL
jgi:ABC-type nitrate/sulfonate/bicarbonate transport system substrate-binding protein